MGNVWAGRGFFLISDTEKKGKTDNGRATPPWGSFGKKKIYKALIKKKKRRKR